VAPPLVVRKLLTMGVSY